MRSMVDTINLKTCQMSSMHVRHFQPHVMASHDKNSPGDCCRSGRHNKRVATALVSRITVHNVQPGKQQQQMEPTFAKLSQAFLQRVRRRNTTAGTVKALWVSLESVKGEWQLDGVEPQSLHSEHDCGKILNLQDSRPLFAACATATVSKLTCMLQSYVVRPIFTCGSTTLGP